MNIKLKKILQHNDSKILINNFLSLSLLTGVNFLIPLLVLPYIIKKVGVSNYGTYAFIYSIVFYFLYITQYGFSLSAVRDIAQVSESKKKVNQIFNKVIQTKIIIFIICTIIVITISRVFVFSEDELFLFYTTYLIVLGDILNPTWLYQGMEKMKFMTIVNVISKLSYVVLIFLLIQKKSDFIYLGLFQAVGYIISGIISLLMAMRIFKLTFNKISFNDIIEQLKSGFSSFVTLVVPMLYVNTSTFLLGVFGSTTQVAYFDGAYKISNGFVSLNQILTSVLYPFINRKSNKFFLVATLLIITGFVMSIVCFLLSGLIVDFLFGNEMFNSIYVLKILSLTPLLLSIRSAFGINYLLVHKKDLLYMKIALVSSVTAFVVGLFLIYNYKSTGAAMVVIFAQSIYSISSMYFALKLIKKNKINLN